MTMDAQMKKGLLDACILAALEHGENYGYKIIYDIRGITELSEGTLYPLLRRLEVCEYLTVRTKEQDGRLRKYYKITALGRDRLSDLRKQIAGMDKILNFIGV